MRVFAIIAFILLCIKCINSNENHLASMVTDFSTLLRLANGLSIRTELISGNLQISDVISDLLNLGTGKSLSSLSKMDLKMVIEKLDVSDRELQNIDSFLTPDDFNFIYPFTTEEEIEDSFKLFEEYGSSLIRVLFWSNGESYNTSYLKPLSEFLESLKSGQNYKTVEEKFSTVNDIYKSKLEFYQMESYLYIKTLRMRDNEIVEDILKLFKISDFLNSFPLNENETISDKDEKQLDKMIVIIGNLSNKKSTPECTHGFPRGGSDIKLMLKDLPGKWLQEELEKRKISAELRNSLSFLDSLPSDAERIQEQWSALGNQSQLEKTNSVIQTLRKIKKIGVSLKKEGIHDFQNCSKQHLSGSKITYDFEVFNDMTTELRRENKKMHSLFEKINSLEGMKTKKYKNAYDVFWAMKNIVSSSENETEKVKMLEKMKIDYSDYISFADDVRQIADLVPPYKKYEEDVRSNFSNALVDMFTKNKNQVTERLFLVECINSTTSNFLTALENDWLGRDMKNFKSNLPTAIDYIKKVSKMQKTMSDIINKYGKASRSRREAHMPSWGDGSQHVRRFAKGVEILSHFSKILELEKELETIAKSGDEVDTVIEGIPEVKMMWTRSYKKKILELIKKVKILNKKAGELRNNETRRFNEIFEEAHDIWGVPIDLKLLADKTGGILKNSSESGAQEVADSLVKVSDLQLDFSGYYLDLSLAKGSIESFWGYLDQIYGVVDDDKKSVGVVRKWRRETTSFTPEPTDTAMFFCIFIPTALLLFLVIICSLCWYDKRKQQKQRELEDPILCSRYLAFQEEKFKREKEHVRCLLQAVENDDLASARLFVEQGAWINAIRDTFTCLHIASTLTLNPSMVSLLIRNGANRRALNRNYRTAWEEVEEEIAMCQDILSEVKTKGRKRKDTEQRIQKLKAVDLVFQRFEGKKFARILPDLMPTSEFRIYVDQSCAKKEELKAFNDKFPQLIAQNPQEATHVIVGTTNGTFQMAIDNTYHWVSLFGRSMLMDGSAWVKAILKKGEKALRNDYKYQIKKVQVGNSTYDGYQVELAHRDWHMRVVPILQDVVIIGDDFLKYFPSHDSDVLKELFKSLGATWHDQFPSLAKYNHKITHPYHFFDTPLFWRPIRNVEIQNPDLPRPLKNPPIPGPKKFRNVKKTDVFFEMDFLTLIGMLLERNYTYDPEMEPRKTVLRMDGDPVQETSEMLKKMKKVISEKMLKVKADDTSTDRTHESIDMNWTE